MVSLVCVWWSLQWIGYCFNVQLGRSFSTVYIDFGQFPALRYCAEIFEGVVVTAGLYPDPGVMQSGQTAFNCSLQIIYK